MQKRRRRGNQWGQCLFKENHSAMLVLLELLGLLGLQSMWFFLSVTRVSTATTMRKRKRRRKRRRTIIIAHPTTRRRCTVGWVRVMMRVMMVWERKGRGGRGGGGGISVKTRASMYEGSGRAWPKHATSTGGGGTSKTTLPRKGGGGRGSSRTAV